MPEQQMVPLSLLLEWMERALTAEATLALVQGPRLCRTCGKELLGARRTTKMYCDDACKQRARRQRVLVNGQTPDLVHA